MKNLAAPLFVFLVATLGCSNIGSNSSTNPNSTNANSASPDPKAAIQDAFKKFRAVPFVTVKDEGTEGPMATVIEQYSASDEAFSRKYLEQGDRTEVIIVGKDNYSKMNEFWPWRVDSGSTDTAANTFFFPYDSLERMIPEFNVKDSREESVDGKTALVVTLVPPKPYPEVPASITIWIGKDNGLPLKMEKESRRTETFDYETPVKIEKPRVEKK